MGRLHVKCTERDSRTADEQGQVSKGLISSQVLSGPDVLVAMVPADR